MIQTRLRKHGRFTSKVELVDVPVEADRCGGCGCKSGPFTEWEGRSYCDYCYGRRKKGIAPTKSKSTMSTPDGLLLKELAPENNSHYHLGSNYGLREAEKPEKPDKPEKPEKPLLLRPEKIRGMSLARFIQWCQLKDGNK